MPEKNKIYDIKKDFNIKNINNKKLKVGMYVRTIDKNCKHHDNIIGQIVKKEIKKNSYGNHARIHYILIGNNKFGNTWGRSDEILKKEKGFNALMTLYDNTYASPPQFEILKPQEEKILLIKTKTEEKYINTLFKIQKIFPGNPLNNSLLFKKEIFNDHGKETCIVAKDNSISYGNTKDTERKYNIKAKSNLNNILIKNINDKYQFLIFNDK